MQNNIKKVAKMNTNTIICEYNPFHNGHKYQIDRIKAQSDDPITAIMSGSFTQRGDVAIYNKYQRASSALKNGADLVIELPTVYAVSSAQTFAGAGVEISKALGLTKSLCFSSEDSVDKLFKAAELMESDEFNVLIKNYMKKGQYYPQAVATALGEISAELAEVCSKPNNILALEYIKSIRNTGIGVTVIERKGASHDSNEVSEGIASASKIRELIFKGNGVSELMPGYECYSNPAYFEKLSSAIMYRLRSMTISEMENLPEISEGLENRLYKAARECGSIDELLNEAKTKRYTMARLRRILCYALLGITDDMQKTPVPYLRILGFNSVGETLLREIKRKTSLPLIINVADGYKKLDEGAGRIFDVDLRASDIRALAETIISPCGSDFTSYIVKA